MSFDCILVNVEKMEKLRQQQDWSLTDEGVLASVFSLIGVCEGPINFPDKVVAAFLSTKTNKWVELRDSLIDRGVLYFTDEGHLYVRGEGDLFRLPKQGRGSLPTEVRAAADRRSKGACAYCGTLDGPFHHDHLLPVVRGGKNNPSNIVLACRPCNLSKGSKTLLEWVAVLRRGGTA